MHRSILASFSLALTLPRPPKKKPYTHTRIYIPTASRSYTAACHAPKRQRHELARAGVGKSQDRFSLPKCR